MNGFLQEFLNPILAVAGGILAGYAAERTVRHLIHLSGRTRWKSDDLLFGSMKGLLWPLFLVIGGYMAIRTYPDIPEKYLSWSGDALKVIVIMLITFFLTRVLSRIVKANTYSEERQGTSSILVNLVRTVVISVGIMVALQSLGISIQPLLTALGITGLAVALALQSTLSNFFSGLHIIASKKIRPGDYIRIDLETEGHVTDINWRSTTIRQLSNNLIIIPNAKLADAIVVNTSMPDQQSNITIESSVSYSADLEKTERVAMETALEVRDSEEGCVRDFEPLFRFHTFGDSGIGFRVILRVYDYTDQFLVRHAFIKKLIVRFRQEGIEIPFPTRTIHHVNVTGDSNREEKQTD